MFGLLESGAPSRDDKALMSVLDRRRVLPALDALIDAVQPSSTPISLDETAVCLDSSVFLRLASHTHSADIIDYFTSKHTAPLILPGQAIQEFWNNQLQAVDTVASGLKRKFEGFKKDFSNIDPNFGEYADKMAVLLDEFGMEHGHIYDEATVHRTGRLFDVLRQKAVVPYVPRLLFNSIAAQRKMTNTPPGFRDPGDGDFFIWADLLRGLQISTKQRVRYSKVALVTEDSKKDWSRAGVAHPMLTAEIAALFRVPFEIWRLDRLAQEVADVFQTDAAGNDTILPKPRP